MVALSHHTQLLCHVSAKSVVDHNFWSLEHFLREWHIRLHLNNINRHSGIEIPKAWMPTIRQHNIRPPPQRTAEGSVFSSHYANTTLDRNAPTMSEVCDTPITDSHVGTNSSTQKIDFIAWWGPAVCGRVTTNIKVTVVRQMIKLNPSYTLSMMINIFHHNIDNLCCFITRGRRGPWQPG